MGDKERQKLLSEIERLRMNYKIVLWGLIVQTFLLVLV
jgi:hypothetical protein|tara:strand:- start:1117 stop:1230 length:114 start_codon:yes stop_codon:yes gene_type:complete